MGRIFSWSVMADYEWCEKAVSNSEMIDNVSVFAGLDSCMPRRLFSANQNINLVFGLKRYLKYFSRARVF